MPKRKGGITRTERSSFNFPTCSECFLADLQDPNGFIAAYSLTLAVLVGETLPNLLQLPALPLTTVSIIALQGLRASRHEIARSFSKGIVRF